MSTRNTGYAGALLVLIAILTGGAALWTVAGQASEQEEEKAATATAPAEPAAKTESQPEPAAPADSEAPAEVAQPMMENGSTGADTARRVEDVLALLAAGGAVPAELRDPAFDYYVDLTLLGEAWVQLDPKLLTDLALQFVEGERVLLRPHRAIDSSELLEIAMRTAAVKADTETLERLKKAVDRVGDKQLAAELERAEQQAASGEGREAWMLPVATTTALEFARYKGILQDIEAAIVVRDTETLQSLRTELDAMGDLPAGHREKLAGKITRALDNLQGAGDGVSEAARVLDKLAYATRRGPAGGLPSVGHATMPSLGNLSRWLSLSSRSGTTPLPPGSGYLQTPGGDTPSVTQMPQSPTACQAVTTQCPIQVTRCPPKATRCPSVTSVCPPEGCQTPTQTPQTPTQCQAVSTTCPQGSSQTYCPAVSTRCPPQPTQCAPQWCDQPTQRPQSPTQCAPQWCDQPTQQPQSPTQCAPQWCDQPTQQPQSPTQCAPHLCDQPTQRAVAPTQCSPAQGKCERPTLYPNIPTSCPAIQTRCPYSETYCPPVCGQQQQQKQRWIPPRKGKYGESEWYQPTYPGSQQYGSESDMTMPYPRRYDSGFNQ